MTEYQPSDIRISDKEREDALGKLGEHMSEGRLDIDEYGERTAKVTAAKTRGELLDIFGDLPEPRPAFGRPAPPPAAMGARGSVGPRLAPALVPIAMVTLVLLALALTAVTKAPFVFLLPFMFFAISGSRWRRYDQRRREEQRRVMREQRDVMREYRRGLHPRWRDESY